MEKCAVLGGPINVVVSSGVGIEAVFMEMAANEFAPFMGKLFRKRRSSRFSMASEGYSFFFCIRPGGRKSHLRAGCGY